VGNLRSAMRRPPLKVLYPNFSAVFGPFGGQRRLSFALTCSLCIKGKSGRGVLTSGNAMSFNPENRMFDAWQERLK
jgi:hypothetical protein